MNESKKVCCERRKEMLNKMSNQETQILESVSEWIKWTKSKKICDDCKEFRTDSLDAMDKTSTEADKDTYLKKYFTVK